VKKSGSADSRQKSGTLDLGIKRETASNCRLVESTVAGSRAKKKCEARQGLKDFHRDSNLPFPASAERDRNQKRSMLGCICRSLKKEIISKRRGLQPLRWGKTPLIFRKRELSHAEEPQAN